MSSSQGQKASLVIIDDEPPIRKVLQLLFREHYAVQVFDSSEAFTDGFVPDQPYVLVVDKNLPGISGLELIRQLRQEEHNFESVLITAYADMDSAILSVELGIYSYLRKPFETDVLLSTVAGAQERLSLRLQLRATNAKLERQNLELSDALEKLKASEAARAVSERLAALGQVSASVAHELNNSLAYVVNNISLVEAMLPGIQAMRTELEERDAWQSLRASVRPLSMLNELDDIVTDLRSGLGVMQRLSTDMGTLARPGQQAAIFDLREAVQLGVRMAAARLKNTATLSTDIPETQLRIHGRHHRLVQVVLNLLVNAGDAVKASGKTDGRVQVALGIQGDRVRLRVTDNGCGIPADRLDRICEPFVTHSEHGTGVGLALVSNIIEEHDGELTFESEVGHGTTVIVELPLSEPG